MMQKFVGRWKLLSDFEMTSQSLEEISKMIRNGATSGRLFTEDEDTSHFPEPVDHLDDDRPFGCRMGTCRCQLIG